MVRRFQVECTIECGRNMVMNIVQLGGLYFVCSQTLIRVSISRDISWAGHTACIRKMKNVCTFFVGKLNLLKGISGGLINEESE